MKRTLDSTSHLLDDYHIVRNIGKKNFWQFGANLNFDGLYLANEG